PTSVTPYLGHQRRVIPSQHVERRCVHDQRTTVTQYTMHLFDGAFLRLIVQTIQDVEREDCVERFVGEWEGVHAGLCNPARAVLSSELQPPPREVDTMGAAELLEEEQIGAGAAAAVEQSRSCDARDRIEDEGSDEATKSSEPEMTLLSSVRLFEH